MTLKIIGFEVTQQCNLKCKHCYLGNNRLTNYLSDSEVQNYLSKQDISSLESICFTGGEPMLDLGIFNKIGFGSSLGLEVFLNTNATLIKSDSAKKLKNSGLTKAVVTLSGDLDSHETIYGENTYYRALNGIINMLNNDIDVGINCLVYPKNFGMLDNFRNYLSSVFGIIDVSFTPIININGMILNNELLLSDKQFNSIDFGINNQTNKCKSGTDAIFIRSNGDIVPCLALPNIIIGNIKEND